MKNLLVLSAISALAMSSFGGDVTKGNDDDDNPAPSGLPAVSVNASDPVAFRGLSSGAFLLHRNDTNGDLGLKIVLSGTATNGVDYTTLPTSVTIPAGFYSVGLPVTPIGSGAAAPDRWVTLTIETNAAYHVGHPSHASVQIKANAYEDQPPVVSITSPVDNTSVATHSDIAITAAASDPNDSITKVSFYAGDRYLGSVKAAPFTITWSNAPAGSYSLFARAEDQFGKSTLSTAVHLNVTNPPPAMTKISLTAPTAGTSFEAGANITLAADVTGTAAVRSVSFYAGDKLLGTDDTAPYTFTWNNVAPGSYSLRAKVTEASGGIASSDSVKIKVTNAVPTVTITSPTNNTVVAGPKNVTITATAADANGSVAKVSFYGDGKSLGSVTTAPYSLTWTNVLPGKHVIHVTASDAFGAFSSAAVTINVTNPAPVVNLVAPADGTTLQAPATVELKADASDADGIQYVSFWSGNRRLGPDSTSPYSLTVSNLVAGSYTFVAHAVDIYGQRTVSSPVKVTVK